ncbi:hypothetical protein JB92DRAFT_3130060 [Gautieria morchelliformis]|nr:hypothetical protein JB92DRAFT_3130060 [Gautieria morchelliformis]
MSAPAQRNPFHPSPPHLAVLRSAIRSGQRSYRLRLSSPRRQSPRLRLSGISHHASLPGSQSYPRSQSPAQDARPSPYAMRAEYARPAPPHPPTSSASQSTTPRYPTLRHQELYSAAADAAYPSATQQRTANLRTPPIAPSSPCNLPGPRPRPEYLSGVALLVRVVATSSSTMPTRPARRARARLSAVDMPAKQARIGARRIDRQAHAHGRPSPHGLRKSGLRKSTHPRSHPTPPRLLADRPTQCSPRTSTSPSSRNARPSIRNERRVRAPYPTAIHLPPHPNSPPHLAALPSATQQCTAHSEVHVPGHTQVTQVIFEYDRAAGPAKYQESPRGRAAVVTRIEAEYGRSHPSPPHLLADRPTKRSPRPSTSPSSRRHPAVHGAAADASDRALFVMRCSRQWQPELRDPKARS